MNALKIEGTTALVTGDAAEVWAARLAASDVGLVFNSAGVVLNAEIAGATVIEQARREMEVN